MTEIHVFSAALLLVGMVAYVAAPLTSRPSRVADAPPEDARDALLQRKARLYQSIRDAELDRQTGKLSETDHQEMVASLRGDAARVLRELDALGPQAAPRRPSPSASHHAPKGARRRS